MRSSRVAWLPVALAAFLGDVGDAETIEVPGDYPTIKAAIEAASDGDEVVIADGTYVGTGNKNITLDKAITVRSAHGAAQCIVDAQDQGSVFNVTFGVGADTIIQGLTLRQCSGPGGGLRIQGSPTIRDCVLTDCVGVTSGAAIWMHGPSAAPTIERCVFADNGDIFGASIAIEGGAHPTITGCVFSANIALGLGAAVYINSNGEVSITDCTFVGNLASAIYLMSSGKITIVNCLFSGNDGSGGTIGAGIHVSGVVPSIVNCTFSDNIGPAINGKGTVANSILVGSVSTAGVPLLSQVAGNPANFTISFSNVENGWNGAGSNNIDADPLFATLAGGNWTDAPIYDAEANLTIYTDTTAAFVPGALVGRLLNPDTSQHRRQYIAANDATTIGVHGDFTPDDAPTLNFDNLLVEARDAYEVVDARPAAGSPVVDAGNNEAVPRRVLADLDGNPRFVDDPDVPDTGLGRPPLVDMGAFERQVPLAADLDGDGAVDGTDLGMLLGMWGSTDPEADLNGDGTVGADDLGLLLGAWTG